MRLGLYVGSFDPIHTGHIKVIDYLKENNYVDKIIIMPTQNYWDKQDLTDINIRFDMIKKIKRDFLIYDNENNKYKYTYEIINKIKQIYPNDEIYLIIAADNIINFDKWMNVDEILKNNKVIVVGRDNINIKQYTEKFKDKNNFIIIQDFPYIKISSTELKEYIDKNYLDKKVYNFINKENLYKKD